MTTPTGVHPVADLFPMLSDDELKELAEDITTRGLLQPIVLDGHGRVLDGRNRLAACELAGVEPEFTTYDGDDSDGYALAVNGQRREMTKRQKAIVGAVAILSSNLELEDQQVAAALGVTKSSLSEAIIVANYKDLVTLVLAGGRSFALALDDARDRDRVAAEVAARKDRLRQAAPDLAAHVDDELMSLDDAINALNGREEKARQEAEAERLAVQQRETEEQRQRQAEQQEHAEAVERDRNRIRMVVSGWGTIRTLLDQPGSELAAEIVGGLGEGDREALTQILSQCRK